jgi:hypothetical protein
LVRIAGPLAVGPSRALFERRVDSWNDELPVPVSAVAHAAPSAFLRTPRPNN